MTDAIPLMPEAGDLPDALRDLKDVRWRRFVWAYVFNGANGSAAAKVAGYSDASEACKVRAHALLQRDDIQAAIKALCSRYLFSLAPKAILRLDEILDNPKHPKHADVAVKLSGHTERSAVDVNVNVEVNHTDAAVEDLRRLLALGVPDAKLVEMFGYSGLDRYRKMLAAADAKLIEGRVE